MSAAETVSVPKDLLKRVKDEVDTLRAENGEIAAERDRLNETCSGLSQSYDAMQAERDQAQMAEIAARAERDDLREALRQFEGTTLADVTGLRAANDQLQREVADLRERLDDAEHERSLLLATHPAPPLLGAAARPSGPPLPDPSLEILSRAFVAWCRRGSPLVSRSYLFEAFLREAAPGRRVEVRAVFRQRVDGLRFGPADGVEYWHVRLGDTVGLVPQPESPRCFRELSPTFSGEASPGTIERIEPADPDDDAPDRPFGLAAPGRVRAEP